MELSEARLRTADALQEQTAEFASDGYGPEPSLAELRSLDVSDLLPLIDALRSGNTDERQLSARLCFESTLSSTQTFEVAQAMLVEQSEPVVLRWVVVALGKSRSKLAIDSLDELAKHASSIVRFHVPDALSACAHSNFNAVGDALILLSEDHDDNVRWSAIYELGEWHLESDDPRIRRRLVEAETQDNNLEIQQAARLALEEKLDQPE